MIRGSGRQVGRHNMDILSEGSRVISTGMRFKRVIKCLQVKWDLPIAKQSSVDTAVNQPVRMPAGFIHRP